MEFWRIKSFMEYQCPTDLMVQLDNGKIQEKFLKAKNAGHMGDKLRTMLNLEVVKSDLENNLLYLKGSIPGSKNSTVFLRESVKNVRKKLLKKNMKQKLKIQQLRKGKKNEIPPLRIDGAKTESIEISDKLVKLKVNHKLIKLSLTGK